MWRDDLRVLITHRHANFTIVLVTVIDCFLVVANILADFNVIDGEINGLRTTEIPAVTKRRFYDFTQSN